MVTLDLQEFVPQGLTALLGPDFPRLVLDDLATAARAHWIMLAQRELHSSKRDYINGIQEVENTGRAPDRGEHADGWSGVKGMEERTIVLVGWLPNAVEQGMEGYDLRDTLLGDGAKTNAQGQKYRAIPFRHGTPGSQGGPGAPMGARMGPQPPQSLAFAARGIMSKGQAAKLGRAIYQRAKNLGPGQSLGTRKGGTGFVPVRTTARKTDVVQVPKLAPWHKTDIFAGMKRERKTYKAATQSQYVTFRTISEANPEGWIHPGIQGRHLAPRVEQFVQGIAQKAVFTAVRSALKGVSA